MGGADTEISDDDHRRRGRDGLVRSHAGGQDAPAGWACAPRRRLGSSGAATPRSSTWPRPASSSCSAARSGRRPTGMVDERGELPDRSPIAVRPDRVNARARLRADGRRDEGAARPDRLHHRGRRRRRARCGSRCRRTASTPTPRSTSSRRSAVMYGYARLGKTMPVSTLSGGLTRRQRERRAPAHRPDRPRVLARPRRCRSSRRATSSAPDCPVTASRSPTRWWPRSRCCAPRCCRVC